MTLSCRWCHYQYVTPISSIFVICHFSGLGFFMPFRFHWISSRLCFIEYCLEYQWSLESSRHWLVIWAARPSQYHAIVIRPPGYRAANIAYWLPGYWLPPSLNNFGHWESRRASISHWPAISMPRRSLIILHSSRHHACLPSILHCLSEYFRSLLASVIAASGHHHHQYRFHYLGFMLATDVTVILSGQLVTMLTLFSATPPLATSFRISYAIATIITSRQYAWRHWLLSSRHDGLPVNAALIIIVIFHLRIVIAAVNSLAAGWLAWSLVCHLFSGLMPLILITSRLPLPHIRHCFFVTGRHFNIDFTFYWLLLDISIRRWSLSSLLITPCRLRHWRHRSSFHTPDADE